MKNQKKKEGNKFKRNSSIYLQISIDNICFRFWHKANNSAQLLIISWISPNRMKDKVWPPSELTSDQKDGRKKRFVGRAND